jgi:hypothetical protein
MLQLITIFVFLLAGSVARAEKSAEGPAKPRYSQCQKENADTILTLSVRFRGEAEKIEKIFLRQISEDEGIKSMSTIASGCGPEVGVTYALIPIVTEDTLEVKIVRMLRVRSATSSREITIAIPFFSDQKDEIDGVAYFAKWQKKKPNQSPEPMPLKRHGSS